MRTSRIALIIVAGSAAVFALALIGIFGIEWDGAEAYSTSKALECVKGEDREHLKALAAEALDDAFRNQIEHLYEVWMKDRHGQPERAHLGVTNAIMAWEGAHERVDKFAPPECPTTRH